MDDVFEDDVFNQTTTTINNNNNNNITPPGTPVKLMNETENEQQQQQPVPVKKSRGGGRKPKHTALGRKPNLRDCYFRIKGIEPTKATDEQKTQYRSLSSRCPEDETLSSARDEYNKQLQLWVQKRDELEKNKGEPSSNGGSGTNVTTTTNGNKRRRINAEKKPKLIEHFDAMKKIFTKIDTLLKEEEDEDKTNEETKEG